VYFLEAGLLLLVVPWSAFWERNAFVEQFVLLRPLLLNPFARGAVSGMGLVCLGASIGELAALWRRRLEPVHVVPTSPAAADAEGPR
jgi:hypothetical protein